VDDALLIFRKRLDRNAAWWKASIRGQIPEDLCSAVRRCRYWNCARALASKAWGVAFFFVPDRLGVHVSELRWMLGLAMGITMASAAALNLKGPSAWSAASAAVRTLLTVPDPPDVLVLCIRVHGAGHINDAADICWHKCVGLPGR
jgi:hypothetical protein